MDPQYAYRQIRDQIDMFIGTMRDDDIAKFWRMLADFAESEAVEWNDENVD